MKKKKLEVRYYKKCENCGHETGKCTPPPKDENKRCWKCGRQIYRDYMREEEERQKGNF